MKKITFPLLALIVLIGLSAPAGASAAELRLFVNEFTVSTQAPAELKATLRALLSTRLAGDGLRAVDSAAEADLLVSGSFTQLGKVFSLDAVAKNRSGEVLASSFEQGEGIDALIPAVGKLATRLKGGLVSPAPGPSAAIVKVATPAPEIVKAPAAQQDSERLAGAQCAMAPGRQLAHGRELVVANGNAIRLYRQDGKLSLLSEVQIPLRLKLIAVDTGEGDREGNLFLYASLIDDGRPVSRIYTLANGTLQLVAQDLPYLFRSLALNGGSRRIYAQRMGRVDDFEGDLLEASFIKGSLELAHPVKLPRYANIFNFNSFRDRAGKSYLAALSDAGTLVVYSEKGEELWRSNDKFGGSEAFIQLADRGNRLNTMGLTRNRFIEQRLTVTERGELLVPQNKGFFVGEEVRSYSNYSLVALAWNGSSLEERWRTKQSDNYLADYLYEPHSRELVLLEVTQHEGVFSKGASALRTIPVD